MFSIEKDVWDVIHLERIETSSDPSKKVLVVVATVTRLQAAHNLLSMHYVFCCRYSFLKRFVEGSGEYCQQIFLHGI